MVDEELPVGSTADDSACGAYMDHHASTPLDARVLDAMMPFMKGGFGNPHSTDHGYGWQADAAVERSRIAVAALIGADADEIVFTSGATEANNLALLGAARAAPAARRRVVVTAIEHKCVLEAAHSLREAGFEIITAPVDGNGVVDLATLANIIDQTTAIVSVMTINNEVGSVQPIAEIAALCKDAGALFHSDAAQALAVLDLNVDRLGIDFLSLSGHKAYGPKGIGALFVRRGARHRVRPIMFGGDQQNGLRPGTLPTFLCVGLGAACDILDQEREGDIVRISALRDDLLSRLMACEPALSLNGAMNNRHPGNLNVRVPGMEAELVLAAARPRLAASTGSACTSGIPEPSHVLRAMGLSAVAAAEAIRIGLGRGTTEKDITMAAKALAGAFAQIRSLDR